MKTLYFLVVFFVHLTIQAQPLVSFINQDGDNCTVAQAAYMRMIEKEGDFYHVIDNYMTGERYMDAKCSGVEPYLRFEGHCVYYYKNGQKQMEGNFINSNMDDNWQYWSENGQLLKEEPHAFAREQLPIWDPEICNEPKFFGGTDGIAYFIKQNIIYPKDMEVRRISGRAVVAFVIDTTGNIASSWCMAPRVHPILEKEAKRLVNAMHWKPATCNGKKVIAARSIPIKFALAIE